MSSGSVSAATDVAIRSISGRASSTHRVVAAGGRLGGYGGNLELKRALLRAEGLVVVGHAIRNFKNRRWTGRSQEPAPPKRKAQGLSAVARKREGGATRTRHGDV